VQDFLGKGI